MWSSRKVMLISTPIFITAVLASIMGSDLAIMLASILGMHLLSILTGFLRIRFRLCPKNSYIPFNNTATKDRSLYVERGKIYTSSRISSTVYVIRGYAAPRALFLHPILLCLLTYFKPLYIGSSQYVALGSSPYFIYVFKSRLGSSTSKEDEAEILGIIDKICGR